uniref:Autophagy protein 5 n=1 Tax=Phallusia mammillata TaxID=59560 RepID=A0A6F9D7P3_9ASCI|nr:autophagy protein 5 [Phallusia mammillata]
MSAISKKLWEGKLPVCFELASHEVDCPTEPGMLYLMVARTSYLTMFSQQIEEFFNNYINLKQKDEVWFEYNGSPLRWHYPCGVLFDLLCNPATDLPWSITVHFQNFPSDVLLRCPGDNAIESNYMMTLKEADQIKHKGQVISNMSRNQHMQLWHGIRSENFDEFWTINKKFMEGFEGLCTFRNIPVRVYFQEKLLQRQFAAEETTLETALNNFFPNSFSQDQQTMKVVIQGISPPLSSSLQWLSENLSYADNFLHICVHSIPV